MKTLLIDDDPFALKMLARQLERQGYTEVTQCESATVAVNLVAAQNTTIGLIFCDLQMPDMDGVEVVRHLSRMNYRGDLVLVSGEDGRILQTAQKLAQAHGMRVLGALAKPMSTVQLRLVLESHEAYGTTAPRAADHVYSADEIRCAIEGGELVNHYQPKVDMATGALMGVEALVRWQRPQAGLVFPDQFIGIAEQHGLIDALTHAVLTSALGQARRWHDAGLDLQLAVNVSMENIAMLDFPDRVEQLARDAGVTPSSLVLEVTESRLMQDKLATLDIVTRLRLKRIGLSIDDFGTGHSSLIQLRDFPFDELKLDRSFVSGASTDSALAAIVKSTINMAHDLGMKTVAEGVETRADWDFIRSLGCEVAQGYFIARPMPASGLAAWQTAWDSLRQDLTASTPLLH